MFKLLSLLLFRNKNKSAVIRDSIFKFRFSDSETGLHYTIFITHLCPTQSQKKSAMIGFLNSDYLILKPDFYIQYLEHVLKTYFQFPKNDYFVWTFIPKCTIFMSHKMLI